MINLLHVRTIPRGRLWRGFRLFWPNLFQTARRRGLLRLSVACRAMIARALPLGRC